MWASKIFSTSGRPSVHRRQAVYYAVRRVSKLSDLGDDDSRKVENLRTTYVKPQRAIGRIKSQLITFDLQYLAVDYIQRLFIYKNNAKFEKVEEKLKDGLSLVLEDFYPLAGKMVKDEEGILKVEYNDEMNGSEFRIGVAENARVRDMVEETHFINFKDFIPYVGVSNYEGLYRSLLSVQLTKLKDGFALGLALNHAIVDGISMWHFMKVWAEKCNDPSYDPIKPFLDRTKARNTRVKVDLSFNPQVTVKTEPLISTKLSVKTEPLISTKVFSFGESSIAYIKSNTSTTKPLSTFACMAAHVWRAVTRARQLMPEDITVLAAFANIRNKLDPPMPENYFGNLIQPAVMATAAGVLYSDPSETSADLIQQAVQMLDHKTIDARTTKWENNPKMLKLENLGENIVGFGSSPKFRVYELNFGWGNPEMVKSGYGNRFDGMVFLHQGKNGGKSIDVDISLEHEAMKRLTTDKDFLWHDE